MKLATLRKRREFLRIRGGSRWSTHAFVLETKQRESRDTVETGMAQGPRIGLTVTKRLGNAVCRNRIRRRLKAALTQVISGAARNHFDYVVIARLPAKDMPFTELTAMFAKAFERVHQPRESNSHRRKRKPYSTSRGSGRAQSEEMKSTTDRHPEGGK